MCINKKSLISVGYNFKKLFSKDWKLFSQHFQDKKIEKGWGGWK